MRQSSSVGRAALEFQVDGLQHRVPPKAREPETLLLIYATHYLEPGSSSKNVAERGNMTEKQRAIKYISSELGLIALSLAPMLLYLREGEVSCLSLQRA